MKSTNLKTKNSLAALLTGTTLAIALGLTFAPSTSAFAMGGGGGGESAPATPKITKVKDSGDKPEDKVAEVGKPAVRPKDEAPAVGGLKTKEPEEKSLAIKDPDEDKTPNKPDERTNNFPEPEVPEAVYAVVGFTTSATRVKEGFAVNLLVKTRGQISENLTLPLQLRFGGTATEGSDIELLKNEDFVLQKKEKTAFWFKKVVVYIRPDGEPEPDETVTITLEGNLPQGVSFDTQSHTITIPANDQATEIVVDTEKEETPEVATKPDDDADDKTGTDPEDKVVDKPKVPEVIDAIVGFATPASSTKEGDDARWTNLQVELSKPLPQTLTLEVVFRGRSASDTDIHSLSETVTFSEGETTASISFIVWDDSVVESDESFLVALRHRHSLLPAGVTFGTRGHVVTIIDNDIPEPEPEVVEATVGFAEAATYAAREGAGPRSLQIVLSEPLPKTLTLSLSLSESSTASAGDITFSPHATFPQGETSAYVDFTVLEDAVPEYAEMVTLILGGALPDGVTFATQSHTIIIPDNDQVERIPEIRIRHRGEISIVNREHVASIRAIQDYLTKGSTEKSDTSIINYGNVDGVTFVKHRANTNGDILIENRGTASGIFAEYRGNVGDVSIENHETAWALSADYDGNIGDVSIGNHGTVGRDIEVDYNGEEGSIEIANHGTVGKIINADHSGKGTIGITNRGTVGQVEVWPYGGGIKARHTGDGAIEVANYGPVSRYMEVLHRGGGNVLIENRGEIDRDMDIRHEGAGDISIANYGTVGQAGVQPYSPYSIATRHEGDGAIEVINYGSVGRDIWAWHRGEGNVLIENQGDIGREIDVRHNGKGDVLIANYGTGAVNVYHYGDGVIRFEGNINKSGEHWLEGETIRLGNIDFKGSEKGGYSELIIVGGYESSSETQLNFHVGPNKDFGKLWIEGDVTGQSRVSLIMDDASFITESTNFPQMIFAVFAEGEYDVKADSFVGEQTVGAFNYVLEHDILEGVYSDKDYVWSFVNRGLSDVAVKTSKTPDEIAKNIETPPTTNPDKKPEELGLWGEQNGSHTTIGLDALAMRWMGGDMTVGTSMARNSSTSNNIDVESQITALTASWERKGFYVGGQTRYASFTSDVSTDRLSVVQDNEGTGVNASADLGYRFVFPFGGMDFEVAPQVQLTWSRVNFDDFVGPHGEKVSLEDGDLVTGRLGLSWDGEWQGAGGFGQVYGGMNLRGAMDGKTSVNVSGVSVANEQDDLSVDGRLGLSYEWDEGYAVHGEVSTLREDDNEIRADLGVRVDF